MITNNDPYIILVQCRNEKSEWFVIGAYFKENAKVKILDQFKNLKNSIRKNSSKHFNIERTLTSI